jgi:hypothetical protein
MREGDVVELAGIVRRQPQFRARAFGQFSGARREVCMDVRFEYVRDAEPALARELAVDIHVPPRVDNRDDARGLTAQGVRVVGETLVFETLEQHAVLSCHRLGGSFIIEKSTL